MRIAVFGAGGLGGYFGARLAADGHEVALIARGSHRDALRSNGLTVAGPTGELHLAQVVATEDPTEIGEVDLVLLAVKTWQLSAAMVTMKPLVGGDTAVVTLQNGVDAADLVAAMYGRDKVLPGIAKVLTLLDSPGVIRHIGGEGSLTLGEWDNSATARVQRIRTALGEAGIPSPTPRDIRVELWTKFLFIAGIGGLGAVTDASFGTLRARPGMRRQVTAAMSEIEQVGRVNGIDLPQDIVATTMAFLDRQPEDGSTSLQRDIADGRPSELDAWTGAVVRLGSASGIPTPVNDLLYEVLSLRESSTERDTVTPAVGE
jgi:2-dehydropantoate 2-reductase